MIASFKMIVIMEALKAASIYKLIESGFKRAILFNVPIREKYKNLRPANFQWLELNGAPMIPFHVAQASKMALDKAKKLEKQKEKKNDGSLFQDTSEKQNCGLTDWKKFPATYLRRKEKSSDTLSTVASHLDIG